MEEAAISPDGRLVALVGRQSGRSQLWLRAFESSTLAPIAGTEGAVSPFWAPDSRRLGFFMRGDVRQVSIAGGVQPRWRADGRELFYFAPDATLLAPPFDSASRAAPVGTSRGLFRIRLDPWGGSEYDVARDGRFLILEQEPARKS